MNNRTVYKKAISEFNFAIQNGFSESHKIIPKGVQLEYRKKYGKYLLRIGFALEDYTEKNLSLWFSIHNQLSKDKYSYPHDYYYRFLYIPERLTDYNKYKITSLRNGFFIKEQEVELNNAMNFIVDNLKLNNNVQYLELYNEFACETVNYDAIHKASKLAEKSYYILDFLIGKLLE